MLDYQRVSNPWFFFWATPHFRNLQGRRGARGDLELRAAPQIPRLRLSTTGRRFRRKYGSCEMGKSMKHGVFLWIIYGLYVDYIWIYIH